EEDSAETLFVVRPRVRSAARNRAAPGHWHSGRDEDGPDESGARGDRVGDNRPSRRVPSFHEILSNDGGGGRGGGRRVAGARPVIVGPSPPAERIAIRHGGVTVKDRDQGWLDASVRRRTAAALWSQVVLVLTGDVRVVCAADGHDVLRGPGRADGPRGTGHRTF